MEKDRGKQWRRTGLFIYCVQGKKSLSKTSPGEDRNAPTTTDKRLLVLMYT